MRYHKNKLSGTKCSMKFGNALSNKEKTTFKCEFCGYSYSTKGSMNYHIASVHEGKNPKAKYRKKHVKTEK